MASQDCFHPIMNIRRKGIRTDSQDKRFKAVRTVEDEDVRIEAGAKKKRTRRKSPNSEDTEKDWVSAKPKREHRQRKRRIALLFALLAVCVGGAIFKAVVKFRQPSAEGSFAEFVPLPFEAEEPAPPPIIDAKDAVPRLQKLLASRDEAEVKSLIYPGEMSPDKVVAFLENFPRAAEIHWVGRVESFEVQAAALIVVPVAGPLGVVFFRPDAEGGEDWLIDFDAFARYSEVPLVDFMNGKKDGGTFRTVAAKDNYYNGAYADDAVWVCYALKSPDHPEVIYGYCRRDGAQAEAMAEIQDNARQRQDKDSSSLPSAFVQPGFAAFRTTLALKRKAGDDLRQAEIVRVTADDWLVTGTDFDNRKLKKTD